MIECRPAEIWWGRGEMCHQGYVDRPRIRGKRLTLAERGIKWTF